MRKKCTVATSECILSLKIKTKLMLKSAKEEYLHKHYTKWPKCKFENCNYECCYIKESNFFRHVETMH